MIFIHKVILPYGLKFVVGATGIRITEYQNMQVSVADDFGTQNSAEKKKKVEIPLGDYADVEEQHKVRNQYYYRRMRKRHAELKGLVANNFQPGSCCFITLTFNRDVVELDEALHEFKKFVQRMNRRFEGFAYVAVAARQKNERFHFHLICNLDEKVYTKEIREIWKEGIAHKRHIIYQDDLTRVYQYLWKNLDESSEEKTGRYGIYHSKNISADIVLRSWNAKEEEQFNEVAELLVKGSAYKSYETKHAYGIQKESSNFMGQRVIDRRDGIKLTKELELQGYTEVAARFTHYHSNVNTGLIEPLPVAVRKTKKGGKK